MKPKIKKRLKKIGLRVRALRKIRGWSQHQLSKKTGISQCHISKVEIHGQLRSLEDFAALLEAFHIPLNRFLKGIYEYKEKINRR